LVKAYKKLYMNFFLVDSPLQLINAIEAKKYLKISIEDSTLVALGGVSDKNFKQIHSLIEQDNWSNVFLIPKSNWKVLNFKSLYQLNKILSSYSKIDKVIIGDYRSNLMRHFVNASNCSDSYLLDDGSASIFVHEKIDKGIGIKGDLGIGRKIIHWIINLQNEDIFNIKYFTIYGKDEDDSARLIRNNYLHMKSMAYKLKRENSVYFLGGCLSELNIISEDDYLNTMKKVKDIYTNKQLYYIPHRRENPQKVKKIEQELEFSVKDFDMPIEWALIKGGTLPYEVASFYSSALDNCHEIFGSLIDIKAFKLDKCLIKKEKWAKIDLIFEVYENYKEGFSIVEI
jgi:hypothetical protein